MTKVAPAQVRVAGPEDAPAIREVHLAAFDGQYEAGIVEAIVGTPDAIPSLSLVAGLDGAVIGHCLTSRAWIDATTPILALGPIAVLPAFQHRGVGSALMRATIAEADHLGELLIVLLGHPAYYGRFGFGPARRLGIEAPAPWSDAAWMALPLSAWASVGHQPRGIVRYPAGFGPL